MRRLVSVLAGTLLMTGSLLAVPQKPKETPGIYCKLTRKKIEKCCCEQREGKLYCTLAKKTIAKCCCKPPQVAKQKTG
jgi:hypothetical protein